MSIVHTSHLHDTSTHIHIRFLLAFILFIEIQQDIKYNHFRWVEMKNYFFFLRKKNEIVNPSAHVQRFELTWQRAQHRKPDVNDDDAVVYVVFTAPHT